MPVGTRRATSAASHSSVFVGTTIQTLENQGYPTFSSVAKSDPAALISPEQGEYNTMSGVFWQTLQPKALFNFKLVPKEPRLPQGPAALNFLEVPPMTSNMLRPARPRRSPPRPRKARRR